MKFKKGDKVRILPSAVDVNVDTRAVDKTGVVITGDGAGNSIRVLMDKPNIVGGYRIDWMVNDTQIELAVKPGEQLLFAFMNDIEE